MVARALANGAWLPFVGPDASSDIRLFCLPYAGAGASVYATWVHELPPCIQACPVELPGRESRIHDARFRTLDALVDAAHSALLPYFDRPFALFGHSMGALIGYAIAARLSRTGGPAPLHLFVSGRAAPHVPLRESSRELAEPEFRERLRALGGIAPEVLATPSLMALLLPILRDDFALCESDHTLRDAVLSCPISAFGGLDDREVSREDLDKWRERTTGHYRLRMLPGGHFFVKSSRSLVQRLIMDDLGVR